jgi:hypothetical protein
MDLKETKTIVPAAAGWYLAFWVEPRGQRPAGFRYEPIIAWELAGDEVGGKWMTPIGLEAWDLYMPEIREWVIRSPDGKFMVVGEVIFDREAEALEYFHRQAEQADQEAGR